MRYSTQDALGNRRSAFRLPPSPFASSGFTLVELLVVITIIAILAGLLLAAASGALGAAGEARIKAEVEQINGAMEDYKNNVGSYPPSTTTDADALHPHLDSSKVLALFKRHLKRAYPQHHESDLLLRALVGDNTSGSQTDPANPNLPGGMNAAEALVFFLTKMSEDPKYPISGIGGPSYSLEGMTVSANEGDPIESRNWWLPPNVKQLGPRGSDNFFDQTDGRFFVYEDPQDTTQTRRINFWYLKAPGTESPYVYFDASRGSSVTAANDPPAMIKRTSSNPFSGADAAVLNQLLYVHPIKQRKPTAINDATADLFVLANDGKFQVLHAGLDDDWGVLPMVKPTDNRELIASKPYHDIGDDTILQNLHFPDGPWTLELADTLSNFFGGTLEEAQP